MKKEVAGLGSQTVRGLVVWATVFPAGLWNGVCTHCSFHKLVPEGRVFLTSLVLQMWYLKPRGEGAEDRFVPFRRMSPKKLPDEFEVH